VLEALPEILRFSEDVHGGRAYASPSRGGRYYYRNSLYSPPLSSAAR
jgi:hypothetical protein